jgi:hypothetical protein
LYCLSIDIVWDAARTSPTRRTPRTTTPIDTSRSGSRTSQSEHATRHSRDSALAGQLVPRMRLTSEPRAVAQVGSVVAAKESVQGRRWENREGIPRDWRPHEQEQRANTLAESEAVCR